MKKLLAVAVGIVAAASLAGCTTAAPPEKAEAPTVTPQATQTPAPEPEPEPVPDKEPALSVTLPEGYPQVVDIATIPDQMRWAFENDGTGQAVAVAPGVWAHLTPGATAEDAVNTRAYDGYCASKEAFEREYLAGEPTGGMCW